MPTLAAYFDTSGVSFLLKKDEKNIEFFKFPYVYSKGTLGNQCSEQDFYQGIIEKFLAENNVKKSCDVVVSGFPKPPQIGLEPKFSAGMEDLVDNSESHYPVIIDGTSLVAQGVGNYFSIADEEVFRKDINSGSNFINNLSIFPQIISNDIAVQGEIDKELVEKAPSDLVIDSKKTVLFGGGRFSKDRGDDGLIPILILSMLKKTGIYNVVIDRNNTFPLAQSMKMYDKSFLISINEYLESFGTFICPGGSVECLVKSEVGEDQFIDLEKERICAFPLKTETPTKIQIKSRALGTVNVQTCGGELGLVFDTRVVRQDIYSNVKLFSECVKQFGKGIKAE